MPRTATPRWRKIVPLALLAAHGAAYAALSAAGAIDPFEFLGVILLVANAAAAALLASGRGDLAVGAGIMALVAAHAFLGARLAPDSLTSGAILVTNILVVFVGANLHRHLPRRHFLAFVASFLALWAVFVLVLDNAEALFLLFVLLLCACARSFRLLAYFWALAASFTVFQPYAWETLLVSFFLLTALFRSQGEGSPGFARVLLGAGLALVGLAFLPILVAVMGENFLNIEPVLSDPRVRSAIGTTFLTATVSTAILLLVTVPLAYGISRLRFPGRTALLSVIDLPVVIPQSVAGIALVSVLGRNQYLGELVHRWTGLAVDNTVLGVVVAQVIVALPFLAKSAIAAFDAVPVELESVARTLGASPSHAFGRVALPLASRGILLGAALAWARAAGEFGAVVILAPIPVTAPVEAYNRFVSVGAAETAPLVVTLLLFSFVMFFLLQSVVRRLPAGPAGEAGPR